MAREELVKVPAVILGSRLRAKRRTLRMSQHQLGGEDFSPSYVSAVERGKIRPSLKALYILADRLGEPVTHFLQDEEMTRTGDALEEALNAARIDVFQGRFQDAIARLQAASLNGHTAEMQARVHLALGEAQLGNHEPAKAHSTLLEALRLADNAGNALLAAYARLYQGVAYYDQQKPGLALEFHRRCLQSVSEGGIRDLDFCLQTYRRLGEDLAALGQPADAMAYFDAAMKLSSSTTNLRALALSLWSVSASFAQADDAVHARVYAQKSLATFEALSILSTVASLRNIYATILSETGQKDAAETMLYEAQVMGQCIADASVSATAAIRLGELAAEKKDYARAEKLIANGVEQASAIGDESVAGQGSLALAVVCAAQGRRADAETQFQAAIARLEAVGASDALSKAYFRYGQALVAWGESNRGSEYLQQAYLQSRKA